WNEAHGITPQSVRKQVAEIVASVYEQDYVTVAPVEDGGVAELVGRDLRATIAELERRMREAAADLEFETAARLRDEIRRLEAKELGLEPPPTAAARAQEWTPKPLGPGGGGYDPEKRRGAGRRGRKGP
ncbi:MAG: UvrB/UvrC motif-containing protein, partial [Acetobacteraceae bacterium]